MGCYTNQWIDNCIVASKDLDQFWKSSLKCADFKIAGSLEVAGRYITVTAGQALITSSLVIIPIALVRDAYAWCNNHPKGVAFVGSLFVGILSLPSSLMHDALGISVQIILATYLSVPSLRLSLLKTVGALTLVIAKITLIMLAPVFPPAAYYIFDSL